MYIGNIVSNNKYKFDNTFNVVDDINNIDNNLPTLIVGLDIVKTIYSDFDFLDRKLSDDLFWTFKHTEKKDLFYDDLYYFTEYTTKRLVYSVEYVFIDLIHFSEIKIKNIFKDIKKSKKSIGYLSHNMIYISLDDIIYGLDLNLISYLGYDIEDKISEIKKICTVFLEGEDILIKYKDIIEMLNNEIKYIPYLYSKEL